MEFYTIKKEESKCSKCNPKNRFLFIFCHKDYVDEGWGCKICKCRTCSFSTGIYIFSIVMLVNSIKDLYDITLSDYLYDKDSESSTFVTFFYIKVGVDALIILGILFAVYSTFTLNYCSSVIAYYIISISFLLYSSFCIYIMTKFYDISFWFKIILKIFTVILWFIFDYVLLLFAWMTFCNMVDIDRKKQNFAQDKVFNFGFK